MKNESLTEIAEKMANGYYGYGTDQKKRIAVLGYDYDSVLEESKKLVTAKDQCERSSNYAD